MNRNFKVASKDRTAEVEAQSMEMAAAKFMNVDVRDICGYEHSLGFATFNVMDIKGNETSDNPIAVWNI